MERGLPTRKHFLFKGLLNSFKPYLLFTDFLILIAWGWYIYTYILYLSFKLEIVII